MRKLAALWNSVAGLNTKARILLAACIPFFLLFSYLIVLYFHSLWRIEAFLNSETWRLPSTLYAEAPVLHSGMPLRSKELSDYFRRLNYHKHLLSEPITTDASYSVGSNGIIFKNRRLFSERSPHHTIRIEIRSDRIQRIVDIETKRSIDEYQLEPIAIRTFFGKQIKKRRIVSYGDLPKHLINAVIAIEDRRFYQHNGVDFPSIVRALWNNFTNSKSQQGGSTITQQFVKNSFLSPERSIERKIREAMMATILEARLKKEKILELYVNEIYLGQQGSIGIHGVGEASRFYFGKDAQHLTLSESALLAGLIQAPSALNPYAHPEQAKKRRNIVLLAMKNQKFISPKQYDQYLKNPIVVRPMNTRTDAAPYFSDLVKNQLLEKYDQEKIHSGNLSIFTTLNLEMQEAAEQALTYGLKKIDAVRFSKTGKNIQGCLIAIEPQTGSIRALVGGRSYSQGQFNRVVLASRHPGSAFKPVVYAAALEQAFQNPSFRNASQNSDSYFFTPATLVRDEPWVLRYSNKRWEPKNYDGYYHGDVTLRTALAHSLNVPTARLGNALGWKKISDMAGEVGFVNVKPFPSVALGAFGASPWQVAAAYTVFANQGIKTSLRTFKLINDSQGKTVETNKIAEQRIIHSQTAFLITDMLQSAMRHGTAASSQRSGFTRPAAGKTGTTDDFRDAWFAGYTPQLLCVVWIGYDDNTSIGMNGAQAALPIWLDFMKKATNKLPVREFDVPEGIVLKRIDPATGLRANNGCPVVIDEIFIRGTEPQEFCQEHEDSFWTFQPMQNQRRNSWWRPDKLLKNLRKLFDD